MSQCQMTKFNRKVGHGFVRCVGKVNTSVWCPTWINADEGPLALCDECAKHFIPEYNPNAANGKFFWGWMAKEEFEKAYPPEKRKRHIITVPDETV